MADQPDRINDLFDQFVAEFRAGRGNVNPFLDQVDGHDREQLSLLIEAFIETDPEPEVTPEGLTDPALAAMTARVTAELGGAGGTLSQLLVTLRNGLKLRRTEVVDSLADRLDAAGSEKEKIDGYYHDLEWGTLPAAGISDRVIDSLAAILDTTAAHLREAGRTLGPGRSTSASGLVFSRTVPGDDRLEFGVLESAVEEVDQGAAGRQADPPDRIDQLFTGA
ncbi:MAG: hypothetical protein M3Y45_02765 [Actinomycetota bacterium]|nr:hypothetical protein [Actinomycetota bacterium]